MELYNENGYIAQGGGNKIEKGTWRERDGHKQMGMERERGRWKERESERLLVGPTYAGLYILLHYLSYCIASSFQYLAITTYSDRKYEFSEDVIASINTVQYGSYGKKNVK